MTPQPKLRGERGIAVITAMVLVASAVALAVPGAVDDAVAVARTARLTDVTQARFLARGVELWAGEILVRDGASTLNDHLGERWATPVKDLPAEGGTVSGAVVDLQGRFNLNTLLRDGQPEPLAVQRFQRLVELAGVDRTVAAAVLDWLDTDDVPRIPGGAESAFYLGLSPAYRAANGPFISVSELRLVAGIDDDAYARLREHLTALPFRTAINVNTATPTLLTALLPAASRGSVAGFVAGRRSAPVPDLPALREHPLFDVAGMELDGLGTGSDWFRLDGVVTLRRATLRYHAVLLRSGDEVRVLRRWRGLP